MALCCFFLLLPLEFCYYYYYYFESHVDQTVDRLGTRVEFTETEDLSKKSAWRRQRNFVTVEVFENVSTKCFACSPGCVVTGQPLVRDDSSSGDKGNTFAKMQVTVGF